MSEDKYLYPMPNGKWFISRRVGDRTIYLHQDNALFEKDDAEILLRVLNIPFTRATLDRYFPINGSKGRCPTLELMEICNILDPTNPHIKKKRMVGV